MTVPSDRLAAILSTTPSRGMGRGNFDNNQMIVARAPHPEAFVGKHVAPDVSRRLSKTGEHTVEITNLQGTRMVDSFSRSGVSGWTVGIGVPKAVIMAELWQWLRWMIAATALLSIIGIILALLLARRITWSISGLIAPALALGRGEQIAIGDLEMKETNAVCRIAWSRHRACSSSMWRGVHAPRPRASRPRSCNASTPNSISATPSGGINRVLEHALKCDTEEELGMTCLQVAEEITGSKFGFLEKSSRTAR